MAPCCHAKDAAWHPRACLEGDALVKGRSEHWLGGWGLDRGLGLKVQPQAALTALLLVPLLGAAFAMWVVSPFLNTTSAPYLTAMGQKPWLP